MPEEPVSRRNAPARTSCWTAAGLAFAMLLSALPARAEIQVSDVLAVEIFRFRETNGAFFGSFASGAPLVEPAGIVYGADGNLYVADSDRVLRYDAGGSFLGVFATGGGLTSAVVPRFGPDGNL